MHDSGPDPLGADLALALQLADLADEITMTRFRAIDLAVETKPDMTPVSEADTQVERTLRGHLETARPHDAILGEEYGQLGGTPPNHPPTAGQLGGTPPNHPPTAGEVGGEAPDHPPGDLPQSGRRWIIDPIDGTQGYVRGVPVWATLIALEVHAEPVVGVVSAPALGRRWWASRGGGAHLREAGADAPRPLSVSRVSDLGDAQLCFGGLEDWRRQGRERQLRELAEKVWRTRGFGDFWQYMLVAEGAAEIASDPSVSIWDLAAPLVIVTEAGGRFTDFTGTVTAGGRSALATNGRLHEAARGILAAASPAT